MTCDAHVQNCGVDQWHGNKLLFLYSVTCMSDVD